MYSVSRIFLFTAEQERAHAHRYYELLKEAEGENIEICGSFPVDTFDSLTDLLRAAQHNETEEYKDVYQSFGDQAKEEGFLEAASVFTRPRRWRTLTQSGSGRLRSRWRQTPTLSWDRREPGCA